MTLCRHLNLRECTMLYSSNQFNTSEETKSPWISNLTYRGVCRGSTALRNILTFIRPLHKSTRDFPLGGSPEIGAFSFVFCRGPNLQYQPLWNIIKVAFVSNTFFWQYGSSAYTQWPSHFTAHCSLLTAHRSLLPPHSSLLTSLNFSSQWICVYYCHIQ